MAQITTRSAEAFTRDYFKEGWGFIFVPPKQIYILYDRRAYPNWPGTS
jgi:hypothetical protein